MIVSYDRKAGKITIEGNDKKIFEEDLMRHFTHVTEQVEKDVRYRNDYDRNGRHFSIINWVAILFNIALLALAVYLTAKNGFPKREEIYMVILIAGCPIVNLIAHFRTGGDSWISLFIKRKMLEERVRIKNLEDK